MVFAANYFSFTSTFLEMEAGHAVFFTFTTEMTTTITG
jgi:hypothetical protein